jgi:hypothetical protein
MVDMGIAMLQNPHHRTALQRRNQVVGQVARDDRQVQRHAMIVRKRHQALDVGVECRGIVVAPPQGRRSGPDRSSGPAVKLALEIAPASHDRLLGERISSPPR